MAAPLANTVQAARAVLLANAKNATMQQRLSNSRVIQPDFSALAITVLASDQQDSQAGVSKLGNVQLLDLDPGGPERRTPSPRGRDLLDRLHLSIFADHCP